MGGLVLFGNLNFAYWVVILDEALCNHLCATLAGVWNLHQFIQGTQELKKDVKYFFVLSYNGASFQWQPMARKADI